MKPVLIETEAALEELVNTLISEPALAVDTEFFRETSYFPHLGLVQIAGPDHIACVDPLAFDARKGLAKLLLNPAITKIFHACIQDLEVLYQYLGEIPCPLVDTQIAAAMLVAQDQIGYARLVEEQMGVELEKSQTRTNWLKRPLTSRQIEYAGDDVLYLLPMYEKLRSELQQNNRESWFAEDCARLCNDTSRFYPDMLNCWKRVKGISRLNGIELSVCLSVSQWREQLAIQKDLTRRKVIPDDLLIQIATSQPGNFAALNNTGQLARMLNQEELESLQDAVQQGLNRPEAEWPSHGRYIPGADEKSLIKKLLGLLSKQAEEYGIAPSVLCSRKEIEQLVDGNREIRVLHGWRFECIGRELLETLDAQ